MITIQKVANGYLVTPAIDPPRHECVDRQRIFVARSPSELWAIAFELLEGRTPSGDEATAKKAAA